MQIVPFPTHYQSVYTNFDFSSFSRIVARQKGHSWKPKGPQSHRNCGSFASLFGLFQACFQPPNRVNKIQSADSLYFKNFAQNRVFETRRVVR